MMKGELHVHLNGLVSTETIRTLIEKEGCTIPNGFDLKNDLSVLKPAKSLLEYLKPWQVLRLIPNSRSSLKLIIENAFLNLKRDNVKFAEIRNSVIYIALLNNVSVDIVLFWLLTDIEEASNKYDIRSGLILTVSRSEYAPEHLRKLLNAYKKLGCPKYVLGVDLAGNELISPPNETAQLFQEAKHKYGLGVTVHAGETGNFENIRKAVVEFGADRIGHGSAAPKSNSIMDLLKEHDVCVEVCPISNRLTRAVAESEAHPVVKFIENNVPFVICSDNPAIHASNLSEDYLEFFRETNDSLCLESMYCNQIKYSFLKGL